jgi:3-keto-5-aminohexanoate cleavage enzyme
MIVQLSTGGRSGAGQERGGMLPLARHGLALGGVEQLSDARLREPARPRGLAGSRDAEAHDVKPEIEAFDLSHILKAAEMAGKGRSRARPTCSSSWA